MSCGFVDEISLSWATTLQCLGSVGLVKVEIQRFLFVTWPRGRCFTWLCRWDSIILSHYPGKFGVHRPCESGDITFFICHVTAISKCHVTLWVGSPQVTTLLILGSIGRIELEIMAFVISVPIPILIPVPIPMPRFTNGQLECMNRISKVAKISHSYLILACYSILKDCIWDLKVKFWITACQNFEVL